MVRSALFSAYLPEDDMTARNGVTAETTEPSGPEPAGRVAVSADAASVMSHYLQDVRQYPLLTHEHELALARQIQEGGRSWRQAFVQSLLVVPDLLACQFQVRRGVMDAVALCEAEPVSAPETVMGLLDRLQALRREMGGTTDGVPEAETAAALRDEMRGLIQSVPWHTAILQQAWARLRLAMTSNLARQQRQARRYRTSLGYSQATLHDLWEHLEDLYDRFKRTVMTRQAL